MSCIAFAALFYWSPTHLRSSLSLLVILAATTWMEQLVEVERLEDMLGFLPVAFSSNHLLVARPGWLLVWRNPAPDLVLI